MMLQANFGFVFSLILYDAEHWNLKKILLGKKHPALYCPIESISTVLACCYILLSSSEFCGHFKMKNRMKKYRNGTEFRSEVSFPFIFSPERKCVEQKIKWASGHGKLIFSWDGSLFSLILKERGRSLRFLHSWELSGHLSLPWDPLDFQI